MVRDLSITRSYSNLMLTAKRGSGEERTTTPGETLKRSEEANEKELKEIEDATEALESIVRRKRERAAELSRARDRALD